MSFEYTKSLRDTVFLAVEAGRVILSKTAEVATNMAERVDTRFANAINGSEDDN